MLERVTALVLSECAVNMSKFIKEQGLTTLEGIERAVGKSFPVPGTSDHKVFVDKVPGGYIPEAYQISYTIPNHSPITIRIDPTPIDMHKIIADFHGELPQIPHGNYGCLGRSIGGNVWSAHLPFHGTLEQRMCGALTYLASDAGDIVLNHAEF